MSNSHYRPRERNAAHRFAGFVYARSNTEYLLLGFDINSSEPSRGTGFVTPSRTF
jgi:hypothetical protein